MCLFFYVDCFCVHEIRAKNPLGDQHMSNNIKITLFHLSILAVQAIYMYISNKALLKEIRCLFVLAMPIIIAYPIILNNSDTYAYELYEYAIVFCVFMAAIADTVCAAMFNKEYLTKEKTSSFHYAYFLICAAAVCIGNAPDIARILTVSVLLGLLAFQVFVRKHSLSEFANSLPLTLFSVVCSWTFLRFGL